MPVSRRGLLGAAGSQLLFGPCAPSLAAAVARASPRLKNGQKWRIGYAESFPFINYAGTLAGIAQGLAALRWIGDTSEMPYVEDMAEAAPVWDWLARRSRSPDTVLSFVPDAFYSNLSSSSAEAGAAIVERLAKGDLDLMICMGTVAGKKIATAAHTTPTLVFSTTNPVAAGIARSETDSGVDHVWAHMDLSRTARQLRLFHETFRFKRLGIAYEDSEGGRSVVSMNQIEDAARRLGFDLVRRRVDRPSNTADKAVMDKYYGALERAWTEIAQEADAMYVTFGQWKLDRLPALARIFMERRIPTFSQSGPEEVERGLLMSIARADFRGIGNFGARTIVEVLGGAKPRARPQTYFDTPTIAWNLEVAERIGYKVPLTALLAADKIFRGIAAGDR